MSFKPYWEQNGNVIFHGHALDVLKEMPDESVQMCVTSPPYWGLRDYNLPPMIWDDGNYCIEHNALDGKISCVIPKKDYLDKIAIPRIERATRQLKLFN